MLLAGLTAVTKSGTEYNPGTKNAAMRGFTILRSHYDNNRHDTFMRAGARTYLYFPLCFRS